MTATTMPFPAPSTSATDEYGVRTWPVWGATAEVVVAGAAHADTAAAAVREVLADVDRTCSRFRADSDLSRVTRGSGSWVTVDDLLVAVLEAALRAAVLTGGLVDPTVGGALRAAGYDVDVSELDLVAIEIETEIGTGIGIEAGDGPAAGPAGIAAPTAAPGAWRAIEIAPGRVRIPPGAALDLGAVGKAYAVDLAAQRLAARGMDAIVSIGGDAAVASPEGATARRGWRVDVAETYGAPVRQRLVVNGGAVATSSTRSRRWRQGAGLAHHVIDPRTGRPALEHWSTVSVVAATCVDANTAATAALVLGPAAGAWLAERGLAARLATADGHVETVCGWPDEVTA